MLNFFKKKDKPAEPNYNPYVTVDYLDNLPTQDAVQVDKDGRGVGKASIATKITQAVDGTIELENFSNQPVALNEVRKIK